MTKLFLIHVPNGLQSIHVLVEDEGSSQLQDMTVKVSKATPVTGREGP
jgi:hypothetical protein